MSQSSRDLSLTRALELYLDDCMVRGLSPKTIDSKRYVLQGFIGWCATQRANSVQQVTTQILEEYRRHLQQYRRPSNGRLLDITTQSYRLMTVKTYFRSLRRSGHSSHDPDREFALPRMPRRPRQALLDMEEIEAILRMPLLFGIKGYRDRAIIEVHLATGVRQSEVANLDVPDVDFDEGRVIVRQGKGRQDRRMPIADRSLAWVQFYLDHVRPQLAKPDSGDALFLTNRGRRFSNSKVGERVSRYVKLAGIRKRGGSTLFRNIAAHLPDGCADLRHVQEMLGHGNVSDTQTYAHVAFGKLKEVYRRTHPRYIGKAS